MISLMAGAFGVFGVEGSESAVHTVIGSFWFCSDFRGVLGVIYWRGGRMARKSSKFEFD